MRPGTSIMDFIVEINKKFNHVYDAKILSSDMQEYSVITDLFEVTKDSFFLKINHNETYSVLKFKDDDAFYTHSNDLQDAHIDTIFKQVGASPLKRNILSSFIARASSQLLQAGDQRSLSAGVINSIFRENLQRDALQSKKELLLINATLDTLENKRKTLMEIREEATSQNEKKSRRRLKLLYGVMGAQMFFTQYGTYYQYSWDIMEPICCLFGVFDMMIAYSYWLANSKDFDFETFEQSYIDAKVSKEFGEVTGFSEDLRDIDSMIEHMELWKIIQSEGLPQIIEALDQKFKPISEEIAL